MSKFTALAESFIPDAQAVLKRFPLAILMALCLTIIIILRELDNSLLSDDMMMRLIGGVILAGYLSVVLTLFGEGRRKAVSILIKACVVCTALLLSYFFRELAFLSPMAIGASILFLGSAPFWRQTRDDVAVWDFTHKLWIAVVFTIAGSIIYMMGIFAISGALKSLFGLDVSNFVEEWLTPIGLAFFAPMAWLSMVPRHDETDEHDSLRNPNFISRAVGFLGAWILAPLTLIYAAILLAYIAKIIMTRSLPNGEIAALVTPFLIIGALTWLILDPPFIQKKRLARWFSKAWFPIMIPAAILLAVATFIRINEYGWTIERYLLVLAAVWALGISLWFIIRGEKHRDIRIIPGFAALLLAIGSIGPWGADGFSAISQDGRLERALKANDMLGADGYLKPVKVFKLDDTEAAQKAKGALSYLIGKRKARRIKQYINPNEELDIWAVSTVITPAMSKDIPSQPIQDIDHGKRRLNYKAIAKRFGVANVHFPTEYGVRYTQYNYNQLNSPIDIKGYDFISNIHYGSFNTKHTNGGQTITLGKYTVLTEKTEIVVKTGGREIARKEMSAWIKNQPVGDDNLIDHEPRLVLYENGGTKIALHILEASYSGNADQEGYVNVQYMVLAKGVE